MTLILRFLTHIFYLSKQDKHIVSLGYSKIMFDHVLFVLGNQQVISLQAAIKKRMEQEGLKGMAVAGGAVLALGAIVGLGMAVISKTSK